MPPRKKPEQQVEEPERVEGAEAAMAAEETPEQAGDGGQRDEQVSAAMDELEGLSETLDLGDAAGAIVASLTDHLVELFKHRPKPWSQLSQSEQRDLIAAAEHNAKDIVRQVVEAVARNGREAVRCLMVGFTDKGDDMKVELKVKAMSREETEAAVLGLHRARGKHVLLTVASADDYHERPANDSSEADQPALGFEAGDDVVTGDDLASIHPTGGPAKDPTLEDEIHTGDTLVMAGHGICSGRVSIKTGMVEALPAGADSETGWIDVREATAAELAHERNRVADFSDEDEEEPEAAQA